MTAESFDRPRKYLGTMRITFMADSFADALLIGNEMEEAVDKLLEDDDTADVTQVIPINGPVTPEELVAQMHSCRDMLIRTRISTCVDLARELDKVAWMLANRRETDYNPGNYNYANFMDHLKRVLVRETQIGV